MNLQSSGSYTVFWSNWHLECCIQALLESRSRAGDFSAQVFSVRTAGAIDWHLSSAVEGEAETAASQHLGQVLVRLNLSFRWHHQGIYLRRTPSCKFLNQWSEWSEQTNRRTQEKDEYIMQTKNAILKIANGVSKMCSTESRIRT